MSPGGTLPKHTRPDRTPRDSESAGLEQSMDGLGALSSELLVSPGPNSAVTCQLSPNRLPFGS